MNHPCDSDDCGAQCANETRDPSLFEGIVNMVLLIGALILLCFGVYHAFTAKGCYDLLLTILCLEARHLNAGGAK